MSKKREAQERLARDLRDLADVKRREAGSLESMADRFERNEITIKEFRQKCREKQILLEVL